jgi:hypothetical protein
MVEQKARQTRRKINELVRTTVSQKLTSGKKMRLAHASQGGPRKNVNARQVGMGNRRAGDLAY